MSSREERVREIHQQLNSQDTVVNEAVRIGNRTVYRYASGRIRVHIQGLLRDGTVATDGLVEVKLQTRVD